MLAISLGSRFVPHCTDIYNFFAGWARKSVAAVLHAAAPTAAEDLRFGASAAAAAAATSTQPQHGVF